MKSVRIPFWKRWLSHFIEYELENIDSDHGHPLSLCLSDGRIQLNADRAIYSWEDKYDNFYSVFEKLDWNLLKCSEVLSLGFGLGSVVQMLEQNFKKSFNYTGVELDEQVIYLAEKYILHRLKSPIQIIMSPAEVFVHTSSEKYDLISIDIFINDEIPISVRNLEFLVQVKELLNPGGLILMNHLATLEKDIKLSSQFFENVFQKVFPKSSIVDVGGNYIFLSDKSFLK